MVLKAFCLAEESAEQPSFTVPSEEVTLTAVRTNGDVFPMKVSVVKINNNVLTAKLVDANEPAEDADERKDRAMSTSSFSSYQDTFSSHRSAGVYPRANSVFGSTLGSFAGVVVDMNEFGDEDSQWIGTGRYTAGREEVYGVGADEVIHSRRPSLLSRR